MARAKRERRGRDPARIGSPGREPWKNPDDDPLRDLRPEDEDEPVDPVADDYVWPDLSADNEEDD